MVDGGDHDHSMAFAGVAFEKMMALRHPATPRNYEIWYNYASAANQALNGAINELFANHGTVTESDLDELFARFFSPTCMTDQIDCFAGRVMGEIDDVVTLIDGTLDATSRHAESLVETSAKIVETTDLDAMRSVIAKLVATAGDIERTNQRFEARLKESRQEFSQLQSNLNAVCTEILTDPLTTLSNRKHFDRAILKAIADVTARNAPLALVMTDIDHFKKFNDNFGHLTGDQVLRLIALTVKHNIRGQDLAARYGGEEFAILLPNTLLRHATVLAEHLRRAVMGRELRKRSTAESLGHVTISLGVAVLRPGDTVQTLIERADGCLYAAKRNGRNRVVSESDPEYVPAKVA
jgi:diguanylate cyclase